MLRKRSQIGLLAIGLLFVLASGCPGTERVDAGNFVVTFATSTTAGNQGFECILIDFLTFQLRPVDPDALAVLSSQSTLGVLSGPIFGVDFAPEETCNFVPGASLPNRLLTEGTYEIVNLRIGSVQLFDEQAGTFQGCGGSRDISASYGQPLTFTVGPNRTNRVELRVNVAELEANLGFSCDPVYDNIASILQIQ